MQPATANVTEGEVIATGLASNLDGFTGLAELLVYGRALMLRQQAKDVANQDPQQADSLRMAARSIELQLERQQAQAQQQAQAGGINYGHDSNTEVQ